MCRALLLLAAAVSAPRHCQRMAPAHQQRANVAAATAGRVVAHSADADFRQQCGSGGHGLDGDEAAAATAARVAHPDANFQRRGDSGSHGRLGAEAAAATAVGRRRRCRQC